MTTLIAVYNSEGCVGRCDARCHEAQEPVCDCICGGMNHGAGLEKAAANVQEWAESMIEEYGLSHQFERAEVFGESAAQGRLAI